MLAATVIAHMFTIVMSAGRNSCATCTTAFSSAFFSWLGSLCSAGTRKSPLKPCPNRPDFRSTISARNQARSGVDGRGSSQKHPSEPFGDRQPSDPQVALIALGHGVYIEQRRCHMISMCRGDLRKIAGYVEHESSKCVDLLEVLSRRGLLFLLLPAGAVSD